MQDELNLLLYHVPGDPDQDLNLKLDRLSRRSRYCGYLLTLDGLPSDLNSTTMTYILGISSMTRTAQLWLWTITTDLGGIELRHQPAPTTTTAPRSP